MMIRTKEQTEANSRRGLKIYHERIKPLLTDEHDGSYIAIDTRTGEYAVGSGEWQVVEDLKSRFPDAEIFVLVHPRIWVHAIGGGAWSLNEE